MGNLDVWSNLHGLTIVISVMTIFEILYFYLFMRYYIKMNINKKVHDLVLNKYIHGHLKKNRQGFSLDEFMKRDKNLTLLLKSIDKTKLNELEKNYENELQSTNWKVTSSSLFLIIFLIVLLLISFYGFLSKILYL